MNPFEKRWKACVGAARPFVTSPSDLPAGFAARVLARVGQDPEESLAVLWLAQTRRALIWATAMMLLCAIIDYSSRPAPASIRPPIESAVLEVMTSL